VVLKQHNGEPKPVHSARCPNCGKPSQIEFRPFCSGRCKDVDLAQWLSGMYAIPGDPYNGGSGDKEHEAMERNIKSSVTS